MHATLLALSPLVPLAFIGLHLWIPVEGNRLSAWGQSAFGLLLAYLALVGLSTGGLSTELTATLAGTGLPIELGAYLDGRNAAFVLLLGLCLPVIFVLLRERTALARRPSYFVASNLLVMSLLGVFTARGLLAFYFYWELALVAAYFWIGQHGRPLSGGPSVQGALMRFVLVTVAGSLPMLLSVGLVCVRAGRDPGIAGLPATIASLDPDAAALACLGFLLAFAIKLPLLGFHGWLRDLYAVAPPACRALLSAVMSKMGAYGLLIVLVPAFNTTLVAWQKPLMGLAVAGAVYGGVVCLAQKRLVDMLAYASLAHLNLLALGAFVGATGDATAWTGALFQALNHGLIMALLFALDARANTDGSSVSSDTDGGLRHTQGRLAALLLVGLFAAASLPGLSSFAGEVMIYLSAYRVSPWLLVLGALGALVTAAASFRLFHVTFLGPARGTTPRAADLSPAETALGLAVAGLWIFLGLAPMTLLAPIEQALTTGLSFTGLVP